ncbi:HAMP domain-containing sensor histidine kinase [Sulfurovum sp.]|uniref:sensor histidine kinase n=1 Tax=Sulfurovum sp. TaxID=1969726 RepID=UPI0028681ED7|nr:HAMP domain-containing sensor histidine kinase [Sulfurovum sp.]
MLRSEKKSLIRFLLIYLGSTLLLFSISAWIFYGAQKHHLIDKQRDTLHFDAAKIITGLRILHHQYDTTLIYPVRPDIESAIYDIDKQYIFGTGTPEPLLDKTQYMKDEQKLYYLSEVQPHYLGASFLLISKDLDEKPIIELQKDIGAFLLIAGFFFTLLGVILGRLFIAPMREAMDKMNLFIQDTTHELNTPISTILTNIEMLETLKKCEKNVELQRIEIASKTLSHLYDDLTYLNLKHEYYRRIEPVNISDFMRERMVYFNTMAENKKLKLEMSIDVDVIVEIDKNDLIRLVDNIITNAIKYNKQEGLLKLILTKEFFSVSDTGIGIHRRDLDTIVCRFKRANKSEGGFGVGLDIVNQVVESYGFILDIHSKEGIGTEVTIQWEK